MISKECFVYIQLPNSHELTTVGKLSWTQSGQNTEVGTFVYGSKYLKRGDSVPLDPFNMPLEEREFIVTTNEGVHGPIRDASPDKWGRYIIQSNTPDTEWDSIGYLLNSAEDRVGALSFGVGKVPPAPVRKFNKTVDLQTLIEASHKLELQQPINEAESAVLMAGAGTGGARPKSTIEDGNNLWLAKFPSQGDKRNYSKIEYGAMNLAKACGLNVPELRIVPVGTRDVFLIKRFDRIWDQDKRSYYKHHFVSGLTLLNLDESDRTKWSYLDLADNMRRWIEKPQSDLKELFKRIVFNGFISNSDDHPRNHGFLWLGKTHRLSPVYDLVPEPKAGSTRYLAMTIGDNGREFTKDNLFSKCNAFDLSLDDAKEIYDGIKAQTAKWQKYFSEAGLEQEDMNYIRPIFESNAVNY